MIFSPPVSIFSPKDMPYCQHSLLVEKKNSEEYIKKQCYLRVEILLGSIFMYIFHNNYDLRYFSA